MRQDFQFIAIIPPPACIDHWLDPFLTPTLPHRIQLDWAKGEMCRSEKSGFILSCYSMLKFNYFVQSSISVAFLCHLILSFNILLQQVLFFKQTHVCYNKDDVLNLVYDLEDTCANSWILWNTSYLVIYKDICCIRFFKKIYSLHKYLTRSHLNLYALDGSLIH